MKPHPGIKQQHGFNLLEMMAVVAVIAILASLALPSIQGRVVRKIRFKVEPIVVKIVKERMERFGNPSSELTARFDLCYCAAAAWERGRFTLDEMREPAYTDPAILDLRQRIELIADSERKTFEGASAEIEFTDGSTESSNVDFFLGTPANPMSDQQLSAVFKAAAQGLLGDAACDALLGAVWSLDQAKDLSTMMSLATLR